MSQDNKIPLARALELADLLYCDLAPGCKRLEIAGSIRRRKQEVGDIELVGIPLFGMNLFGDPSENLLLPILANLCDRGLLSLVKGGKKYRQYIMPWHGDCKLDLFLCSLKTWGAIFTIRTGPAEFSKRLVTQRQHGGLMPSHLHEKHGRLWNDTKALETPEEQDFFAALGIDWIEPWDRK